MSCKGTPGVLINYLEASGLVAVLEALKKLGSASFRKVSTAAVNILTFKENTGGHTKLMDCKWLGGGGGGISYLI